MVYADWIVTDSLSMVHCMCIVSKHDSMCVPTGCRCVACLEDCQCAECRRAVLNVYHVTGTIHHASIITGIIHHVEQCVACVSCCRYGFVVYGDGTVTDVACKGLNGMRMGDRTLTVRRATEVTSSFPVILRIHLHCPPLILLRSVSSIILLWSFSDPSPILLSYHPLYASPLPSSDPSPILAVIT